MPDLMTDAITDSFLAGQGIPVDLAEVETELTSLWGAAAEEAGAAEVENPHVTRIALANLVVESLEGNCDPLCNVVETVVTRFPCRAIVLRGADDPARRIAAEISAICHLPAPGLPQVCSERIVLRAGPSAIDLVPGSVRPLLEAELPMILWWTGDPRRHEGLYRDLAGECSRLILDLPEAAESGALRLGLDPSVCRFSRDSAWFALTRWRELIAQFFDPPCTNDALGRIHSVEITAIAGDAGRTPRVAVWLAAWLAGQLGWKPRGQAEVSRSVVGTTLDASLDGPRGPVRIRIATRPAPECQASEPCLHHVSLSAEESGGRGTEVFRLARPAVGSTAIRIDAASAEVCRLPRLVEAPELDPARRIAAAMESSRIDPPFHNALPIALWLLDPVG
ncbi:MAG: glucose-6-phosphate dehydrogenase assembly protein OpcA [Isosphaeraceae bacterium]